MNPLVSCIMPSIPRPLALQPTAYQCWLRQDYPNRELIVVSEGLPGQVRSPLDRRVRHVQVAPSLTTGERRNLACEAAAGEIIIHWDDDDWSAPDRITAQMEHLNSSGADVAGHRGMFFTDGIDAWLFHGPFNANLGTSLIYRREWWEHHPFQKIRAGEDAKFIHLAIAKRRWALRDDLAQLALIVAREHPANTCKQTHQGDEWAPWEFQRLPGRFLMEIGKAVTHG